MKTIVVDDEYWLLEQFEDECKDIPGVEIVGKFRNPLQALDYARENYVELAFLDIEMQEMNGLELSERLRDISPKMIVIFISAYDGYMLDAFRKQNADYFLIKPYSHMDLENAVERAVLLSGRLRKQILFKTFGTFAVLANNEPLSFPMEKSKELLAILVDKRGALISAHELVNTLCPGETVDSPVYRKILRSLQDTLKANKIADLLRITNEGFRIQLESVDCDLMLFEDGNAKTIQEYEGNYMMGYPWAARTREQLLKKQTLFDRYQEESIQNALCAMIRCRLDEALTLEYVNDSFLAITGYSREELKERFNNSLVQIIVPEDLTSVVETTLKQLEQSDFKEIEYRIKCKNGESLWVLDKGRLSVYEKDGEVVREFECMIIDISAYKAQMTELKLNAERDGLTKLYTRGTCQQRIEQYLSHRPDGELCALLLLDIDNFKKVNDTYGHPFADTVLTDIAAILQRSFRSDDIIGRLGGDEMLIFLPGIPSVTFLRERIASFFANLQKRMKVKTSSGEITCSLGASIGPDDGNSFDVLYQAADIALYHSKQGGKGRPTLRQDIVDPAVTAPADDHAGENEQIYSFMDYVKEQLAHSANLADTIDALLSIIGRQTQSSRVYIFENCSDVHYLVNTFEWCAEDCHPEIRNLQMVPCESLRVYMKMLRANDGLFNIYDINTLDAEVYEILEPQGILSMLHTELLDENGVSFGILGIDECRQRKYWSGVQCVTLKACGAEIGKVLSTYRAQNRSLTQLQDFVNARMDQKTNL